VFKSHVLVAAVKRALREGWAVRNEVELALAAGVDLRLVEGQRFNVPIVSALDAAYAEVSGRLGRLVPTLSGV